MNEEDSERDRATQEERRRSLFVFSGYYRGNFFVGPNLYFLLLTPV